MLGNGACKIAEHQALNVLAGSISMPDVTLGPNSDLYYIDDVEYSQALPGVYAVAGVVITVDACMWDVIILRPLYMLK